MTNANNESYNPQQRQDKIVGYLKVQKQITDTDSATLEKIQIILADSPLTPLAAQRLAIQLLQQVNAAMSGNDGL